MKIIPSILDEAEQGAVGIDQVPDRQPAMFDLWSLEAWMARCGLRNSSLAAHSVEPREIVEPQAASERAFQWVEVGVGEELEREAASLENHPAAIPPCLLEAKSCIELRRGLEVPRG